MGGTLTIRHIRLVVTSTASAWNVGLVGRVGHAVGFSGNGCAVFLSVGCLRTA